MEGENIITNKEVERKESRWGDGKEKRRQRWERNKRRENGRRKQNGK